MENTIQIIQSINEEQKQQAVELFYNSFDKKLKHIWLLASSKDTGLRILKESIYWNHAFYAISNNRVLGIVGVKTTDDTFINATYKSFVKVFGIFGGFWRYLYNVGYNLFQPKVKKDELQIDYIAVAKEARGLGIGSQLIQKTIKVAHEQKKNSLILDVINTNPKAQALYERLGFHKTSTNHYGRITSRAGFTEVIHMKMKINPIGENK